VVRLVSHHVTPSTDYLTTEVSMNTGFITLHRKITEWEWYSDTNTFRLFIHILLHTNHSDKQWKGQTIKRGEFLTGVKSLSRSTKLSTQQIRSCLIKLKSTNEITIKATNRFSIITVVKYDSYQDKNGHDNKQDRSKLTNKQQTNNKQITTTNNVNNDNNKDIGIWVLPEWVNVAAWNEFVQHRKEINKPFSDLAKTKAANCLNGFTPEEQQTTIDTSIQNRWSGLFPKKLNGYDNEAHKQTNKPKSKHEQFWDRTKARLASPT